jgi:hypothetical protein
MEIAATERLTIDLDTGGTFTDGYVSGARDAIRSRSIPRRTTSPRAS